MLLLELFPTPVALFDLKPLSDEERSTIMKTPTGNTPSSYLEVVSSNDQYLSYSVQRFQMFHTYHLNFYP